MALASGGVSGFPPPENHSNADYVPPLGLFLVSRIITSWLFPRKIAILDTIPACHKSSICSIPWDISLVGFVARYCRISVEPWSAANTTLFFDEGIPFAVRNHSFVNSRDNCVCLVPGCVSVHIHPRCLLCWYACEQISTAHINKCPLDRISG